MISITLLIIITTVIISIIGFRNEEAMDNLIFSPAIVIEKNQYYRFVTCGFIHANVPHLFFNMYALYVFGEGQRKEGVEYFFVSVFGEKGKILYLLMYLLALIVCLIPTFNRNRTNYNYKSLGASGAVSAVVFSFILFEPLRGVGLVFIPVFIPGFLFGIIYLIVSYFLDKKGNSHINHSAHIWGALFGICYLIVACRLFSDFPVLANFLESVRTLDLNRVFTTY
jgi:membrane associated rhomboid family serine protease